MRGSVFQLFVAQLKSFFCRWIGVAPGRRLGLSIAALRLAYVAAIAAVAWTCSEFYLPGKGFTALVAFGDRSSASILPELRAVNHYEFPNSFGYDSQFYAQIAMRPRLDDPALRHAVDNLSYRARRILFCWTAYALAGGNPRRALNIYAFQNIAAWFLLAFLLLRWFPPVNWGNGVRWAGVLFSFGLCVSVSESLVDGPSLLLIAAGMALIESRRPWLAVAVFGVAGLGKETNIFGAASLAPADNSMAGWRKALVQGILVLLPLAVWIWIVSRIAGDTGNLGFRNFALPFAGYFGRWGEIAHAVATKPGWGPWGSACIQVALTAQCVFFLARSRWSDPWWRVGAPYALMTVFLGAPVWEGFPGAAARVLLPMTLAFNVLVPRGRSWWIVLLLGNLTVLASPETLNLPGRESYVVKGPRELRIIPGSERIVEAVFDSNWFFPERSRLAFWRWSQGSAGLLLRNPHPFPIRADFAFGLHSDDRRSVRLLQDGRMIWEGSLAPHRVLSVEIANVRLAPGDTAWRFETGPPARSDNPDDPRLLGFSLRNLTLKLAREPGN